MRETQNPSTEGGKIKEKHNQVDADKNIKESISAYLNDRYIENSDGQIELKDENVIKKLWEDAWAAMDFSWDGLKDAGWERESGNFSQYYKRWRAPIACAPDDFKNRKAIHGTNEFSWQEASLQDCWRWSRGIPGFEHENRLLSDEELEEAGFLVEWQDKKYHLLHCPVLNENQIKKLEYLLLARINPELNQACCNNYTHWLQISGCRHAHLVFDLYRSQNYFTESDGGDCLQITASVCSFKTLDARGIKFEVDTRFVISFFENTCSFEYSNFIENATFDGSLFLKGADFSNTVFNKEAHFSKSAFENMVSFGRACFCGKAWFGNTHFAGGAWLDRAIFQNEVWFGGSHFRENMVFAAVEFRNLASFREVEWANDKYFYLTFRGSRFRDTADFSTKNFSAFSAFEGATFERRLLLTDPDEKEYIEYKNNLLNIFINQNSQMNDRTKYLFNMACNTIEIAIAKEKDRIIKTEDGHQKERRIRKYEHECWNALSDGYRVAKQAMRTQGDFNREQRYYKFEVQAKLRRPSTIIADRIVAAFYNVFSDFGASFTRPFGGLAYFFLIFAFTYIGLFTLKNGVDIDTPALETWWEGFQFSLDNTFRPLHALSRNEVIDCDKPEKILLGEDLLFCHGPGFGLFVRFLTIIQSFLSIMLAFLFGLAVRRKFQIS